MRMTSSRINYRLFAAALALIALVGCARSHVPDPTTYEMDAIIDFSTSSEISLINAQPSTKKIVYATDGVQDFTANLHEWTDSAIAIAERELVKRGATVAGNASKELEMSVVSATTTTGGWGWRTFTNLEVTTGDGYSQRYAGEGPSISAFRAADASVMRAVAEMFRDEKLIDYLTK